EKVEQRLLDLNDVVSNVEKMLRRLIGEDCLLECTLAPGIRPIKADRSQLVQVLINLANNARDAMPRGGKLTIETGNEVLTAEPRSGRGQLRTGRYVLLAATDTGRGMPEEVRTRIFEPFFTTKEPGKGPGLGLAMVNDIVIRSGGFIQVESAP